jgi:membrane protein YqaA with SNARE-associated domain
VLIAPLGGLGLFVIEFFDSSFPPLPFVADLLVVRLTVHKPEFMLYYAAMATLGSLVGCFWLYYLAKKGGEAMFRRSAGGRAEHIRDWVLRYKFLGIAVPAILPPPLPFKPFILAAGVFQVPKRTFALALVVGRGFRYTAEGLLAIFFGEQVIRYLMHNKVQFLLIVLAIVAVYAVTWWLLSRRAHTH